MIPVSTSKAPPLQVVAPPLTEAKSPSTQAPTVNGVCHILSPARPGQCPVSALTERLFLEVRVQTCGAIERGDSALARPTRWDVSASGAHDDGVLVYYRRRADIDECLI